MLLSSVSLFSIYSILLSILLFLLFSLSYSYTIIFFILSFLCFPRRKVRKLPPQKDTCFTIVLFISSPFRKLLYSFSLLNSFLPPRILTQIKKLSSFYRKRAFLVSLYSSNGMFSLSNTPWYSNFLNPSAPYFSRSL